jgi:hypothetical protein
MVNKLFLPEGAVENPAVTVKRISEWTGTAYLLRPEH